MENDNLNKKNPGFVAELKARIEKQTQEQERQTKITNKKRVEITPEPSSSTQETTSLNQHQSINLSHASGYANYAELEFSGTFTKIPFKDNTEYAEILLLNSINQAKKLIVDINTTDRKIQGIENLKKLNQSASNLAVIEEEVKKAHDDKLNLITKLSEIREPLNSEFNVNFARLQKKETELEERIKDTHGDINKYNQLNSELSDTRNEHINLIQNNIEFEKILSNHSQDKDLQDEAETHLYYLYNDELDLQKKRLAALEEKKELIKLNSHLHDKESNEKQLNESSADIESCKGRILLLKNPIEINPNSELSEYEINSFYGQEEQQTPIDILPILPIAPTTKQRQLSEPEQLKQKIETIENQREALEKQRKEHLQDINELKSNLSEENLTILSTLRSELDAMELASKEKYDYSLKLKEQLDALVVDRNNKPKHVESIPKSTKEQDAVSTEVTKPTPPVVDSKLKKEVINPVELGSSMMSKANSLQSPLIKERKAQQRKPRLDGSSFFSSSNQGAHQGAQEKEYEKNKSKVACKR